jgi:hypothetical protein
VHTNKHANKHTNKHATKHTNKHNNKHTNKHINRFVSDTSLLRQKEDEHVFSNTDGEQQRHGASAPTICWSSTTSASPIPSTDAVDEVRRSLRLIGSRTPMTIRRRMLASWSQSVSVA